MKKKETFSLRKYKIGTVSVLLGAVFLFAGNKTVAAEEVVSSSQSSQIELISQTTQTESAIASEENTQQVVPEINLETTTNSTKVEQSDTVTEAENVTETAGQTDSIPSEITQNITQNTPVDNSVANQTPRSDSELENSNEVIQTSDSAQDTSSKIGTNEDAKPQNIDSNTIITVPKVWDNGYKGEGTVVAIIDSGIDIEHDVLQISDISTAKFKNEAEIEAAKAAAGIDYGQWFNDKVIYGYNYVDANNVLKEADKHSHGMHVTSIATGNPSKPVAEQLMYGVAPEAQVMFMRVFSDIKATTGAALYARAIEDAVKLGADSINLSLGGANGSVVNMSDSVTAAIEIARRAGVSVVIAAGNDGTFGSGHSNPSADYPDYGLVGSPSTARDAISVASFNNSTVGSKVINIIGLEDNAELNYGKSSFNNPEKSTVPFEVGKEYEYVYAGIGEASDFEGLDLTGKLALIKRGSITFSEKIANATAAGAVGAVIFNSRAGEANVSMQLDDTAIAIPSVFIPLEFGEALANNSYKILFNNETVIQPNPEAGLLSDFSSWGLSADGELKPDLAAPGGAIYAAINDNDYANMQGTSMAAPHVAGAAVLVKQYLQEQFPNKSPQEIESLVKNLLMSTAKAHTNSESGAFTSPRQQGAGIIDTAAAISTGLYVTGEDGYGSITLGNVADSFEFNVTVHNISNQDKTLHYSTQLTTDTIKDGYVTLAPRFLKEFEGSNITIKANSSTTLTISINASEFAEELTALMKNGYYLEGFVQFTDTVDGGEIVSIPYVGFRGEFQNLAVLEEPIYNLIADGNGGFYFEPVEEVPNTVDISQHYTGLVTGSTELIYSTDKRTDFAIKTLGTFKNEAGYFVLELDESGQPHLAISPNDDSNQDSLAFKGVFLRNYTNLVANVYDANDIERKVALWTSEAQSGDKNYYSGDPKNPKSSIIYPTEWNGTDSAGQALADGKYHYVLTYSSEVPGADVQTMVFEVVVDRESPIITTATYDAASHNFNPRPATDSGLAGIYREQVFYLVADDSGITTIPTLAENGDVTISDNKVFVAQNQDGSFTLPLDLADISKFYYTVEDYAGNVSFEKVENLISIGNESGLVSVNILDKDTNEPAPILFSYSVTDSNGNIVNELPRYADDSSTIKLPFGTYTFELFLYDTEWSTLAGDTKFEVTISEENSKDAVNFYVVLKDKGNLLIDIDKLLPTGSSIQLQTNDGLVINVPNAKYSKTDYGKFVPVGNYTIVPVLPEGYEFLEDLVVEVVSEQNNLKKLTLIDKVALRDFLSANLDIEQLAKYYNAESQLQENYQTNLIAARSIVDNKHNQSEVDSALENLLAAYNALNGQETDLTAIRKEISEYTTIQSTAKYYNADSTSQISYDTAMRVAQLTLSKHNVTQVEIDQALFNLIAAKEALNGQETDLTAIGKEISEYTTIQASAKYYNADSTSQISYDTAMRVAQLTLSKHNVTQVEIDQALFNLIAAKEALNGQTTDFTALESEVNAYNSVKNNFVYFNAETEKQKAYDSAVQSAQLVLYQENLTQAVVNQILTNLLTIKADLNGQKTDISALRNAVAVSSLLKTTDAKYINASENVKQAYDQAIEAAKVILEDEFASQELVNQALTNLINAQEKLDGVASPSSEENPSEVPGSDIKVEENKTAPPLGSEAESNENGPSTLNQISPTIFSVQTKEVKHHSQINEGLSSVQPSKESILVEKNQRASNSYDTSQTKLPNTGNTNSNYLYIIIGLTIGLTSFVLRKKQE
ncbi:TPA: S8 family serine peptidase [Streptococcus suis]